MGLAARADAARMNELPTTYHLGFLLGPRINAGGRVTLDVNQEVSNPTSDSSNPNIATRKAQTVVTVSSGETIPLAGLIQETNVTGSSGVPLLSKIPLIGGLFGTQSLTKKRTELVILITPTVITNSDDARAVTDEIRRKLPSLEKFFPAARKTGDGRQEQSE